MLFVVVIELCVCSVSLFCSMLVRWVRVGMICVVISFFVVFVCG